MEVIKIILTGPESSGKTTLALKLSQYYNEPFVAEYARLYLEEKGPLYDFNELLKMAKGQTEAENEGLRDANRFLFCDTDLLTFKIWSEFKFGSHLTAIDDQIKKLTNRFYLLCSPDFPWVFDELRENEDDRWEIFELYKEVLNDHDMEYFILEGNELYRFNTAIELINGLEV